MDITFSWKLPYLFIILGQRLHRFQERNRCALTLFSPWMAPDGGYSPRQLLKKHLFTIFIFDFIIFSKNCVLNTVSFKLKKHSFLLFMSEPLCSSCLPLHKLFLIISQTKRDRNCNFVKRRGGDKSSSLLYVGLQHCHAQINYFLIKRIQLAPVFPSNCCT